MIPRFLDWTLLVAPLMSLVATLAAPNNYANEKDPAYWFQLSEEELASAMKNRQYGVARNTIIFLGDGMGVSTVTAGRILAGQNLGKAGEEYKLSFDKFPATGLSKTYNTDSQVTDSASTATAFLCGVKTNQRLLGLSAAAKNQMCNSTKDAHVDSILRWSAAAGKRTGIVTNTRITHATPGAAYCHSADRDWESDRFIPESEKECEDIALQLIKRNSDINVIMGGGRAYFLPEGFLDPDPDPKYNSSKTSRLDGKNLINDWIIDKQIKNVAHKYVYDKSGFDLVDAAQTDYLLGLFRQNHMTYEIERNATKEPSLSDMVEKAIRILSRSNNGFFLLVEGGRIDHAHHDSQASKSLHEVVEFARAVEMATNLTSQSDTLIVVTADHSHVFNVAGYASRGNPIFGLSDRDGVPSLATIDKMPYTTILYANGPGYNSSRQNLTNFDTMDVNYVYQSAIPMKSETHAGEDVAIYAQGPYSFLFNGVHEQSYIPMAMAFASCVGPYGEGKKPCARQQDIDKKNNDAAQVTNPFIILITSVVLYCFV